MASRPLQEHLVSLAVIAPFEVVLTTTKLKSMKIKNSSPPTTQTAFYLPRFASFFLILLILTFAGCGGGGSPEDESFLDPNACPLIGAVPKIVGGTPCSEDSSPIVKIYLAGTNRTALCTGTLLTSTDVLTAAHCYTSFPVSSSVVYSGSASSSVKSVIIHPQARKTESAYFNDVAILRLKVALDRPTLPLQLSRAPKQGDTISVFGYGKDENGTLEVLRSGRMKLSSVTASHLEALYEGKGSEPCFGDSGGPALLTYKSKGRTRSGIVGIISTGSNNTCSPGDSNLFANIQSESILSFISAQVPKHRVI